MKRAVAFILSLTVIWLQVMASAQTLSTARTTSTEPACTCCAQKEVCRCCCVEPTAPDAKPLPAIPAVTSSTIDFTAVLPKRVAWLLPETVPAIVSSSDYSASSLAVPLFQRDCALLI
ncbi:MAG: hypothetical protein AAB370_04485 [Verrucomicrobiota bacterium]